MTAPGSPSAGGFDSELHRLKEKGSDDFDSLVEIVRASLVAHVGVVIDDHPYVLPMACAPWQQTETPRPDSFGLLLHGSTGSRLMRALTGGAPVCATLTHLDGLVLARSAFESSMTYRSAMLMGTASALTGAAKDEALLSLTDHLLPSRREHVRPTTAKESAATMVLGLVVEQWSVKIGSGFASDPAEDVQTHGHVWSGIVPMVSGWGPPVPDPDSTDIPVPDYVRGLRPPGSPG